ncbi:sulfotransferase family cytosolic 1B member 1 [Aplysia californica]|uniref:Sulfotransferase family cytosolic 1B member 1 n=1 Tax=Aplysia californica TaxID=6500 RepID=A0ABM0JV20_APLCA|nr:sulfotransferase family cytosolic 1B member 1 [Aplysia californica]
MMRRREAKLTVNTKAEAFMDVCHPKMLDALSSPRTLNSHLTFSQLPTQGLAKKTKIVLTVRNHKDTAVSLYNHHTKLFPLYGYDGTFKSWFPLFLQGRVDYGSFFDYYKNWDEAVKSNPDYPILVVAYEDMKEDQPREMKRIAKFLGIELTDDLIKSICEATGISTMKVAYNKGFNVRKGQVGDYKNWFTVAQDEYLDEVAKKKVSGISIYKPRFELP